MWNDRTPKQGQQKNQKQEKLKKKEEKPSRATTEHRTSINEWGAAARGSWTNTAVSRKREIMQRETLCPAQETRAGVETKTELRKQKNKKMVA